MTNNVASIKQIVDNSIYQTLLWAASWALSFKDILQIPLTVVIIWKLLEYVSNPGNSIFNPLPVRMIIVISQDLVKLGAFSTLIIIFIKLSLKLKGEIETIWNILTPRYEEYADNNKKYNTNSIITEGYLPDSPISEIELYVMKSRSIKFFIFSIVIYFVIKLILLMGGEELLVSPLEKLLTEGTTSQLVFAIIGIPILIANLVNGLELSIYPTADTAIFFIEIGIPSTMFILGMQNRIYYHLYDNINDILIEDESFFLDEKVERIGQGIGIFLFSVLFIGGIFGVLSVSIQSITFVMTLITIVSMTITILILIFKSWE